MLHTIDDQGNTSWHCRTPTCSYHNCDAWDRGISCASHAQPVSGQTHTAHVSDAAIQWTAPDLIELPVCAECGEKTTLLVHGDIAEPIIAKDEITKKILQVTMPPNFEHHGNLWFKDADIIKQHVPHPTWAHLPIEQIKQVQEHIRSLAPTSPVDWMIQELTIEDIHSVTKHPAVDRHNALAEQLKAAGKVYEEPVVVPAPTIEETVARLLQKHGLITSPRLPAVNPPTP